MNSISIQIYTEIVICIQKGAYIGRYLVVVGGSMDLFLISELDFLSPPEAMIGWMKSTLR